MDAKTAEALIEKQRRELNGLRRNALTFVDESRRQLNLIANDVKVTRIVESHHEVLLYAINEQIERWKRQGDRPPR